MIAVISLQEIADQMNESKSAAHRNMKKLIKAGVLGVKTRGRGRQPTVYSFPLVDGTREKKFKILRDLGHNDTEIEQALKRVDEGKDLFIDPKVA